MTTDRKIVLAPITAQAASAAAVSLAQEYGLDPIDARRRLWGAICKEASLSVAGIGDFDASQITPAVVDVAFLAAREALIANPPPPRAPKGPSKLEAPKPCRSCKAQIRWGRDPKTDRPHPYNMDGITSHFSTCPDRQRWRASK